ncbi:MAG TPA: hypothetical protein VFT87_06070, partial [Candidatus Saccharimonadales bacterium]|nr:hypothetical protein [Candidatus Saccharimonadales bacterium]
MAYKKIVHTLQSIAARRIFRQFAARHHLVYFGRVDARHDDHEMVMGITASTNHSDDFFTVGTFEGHDVTMVVRRNTLTFPGKPSSTYTWLITQIDLKQALPHIFIDFHHHDETFFANMAVAFRAMQDMSPGFNELGARILIDPLKYTEVRMVLLPHITAGLREHFAHLSVEVKDDQLFVYANYTRPSITALEHELKLAAWLAGQLNNIKINKST